MTCSTAKFAEYREALKIELRSEIEVDVRASLLREIEAERVALGTRYLKKSDVLEKLRLSGSPFERLRRDPAKSFPRPRDPFNGHPVWLESEVDEWMMSRRTLPY